MIEPTAIVLAAGKGTRMNTDLPKVLVEVCGRPMIDYVLDALRASGIEQGLVVVGHRGELVRAALAGRSGVRFVEQPEQLGTGHAVMVCRDALAGYQGPVVVLAGDSPMTQSDSIRTLLDAFAREKPACLVGTAKKEDPTGLGRIVRDAEGEFVGIVEESDASAEQRAITEVNMSTYVFAAGELFAALDRLTKQNAQGEYYITDCPGVLKNDGKVVRALCALKPCEALSINTIDELEAVEAEMRRYLSAEQG